MTTLKEALEAAYLAGFNASGEGYNGEYPFGDKMQDPAENRVWKKDRDNYIKEALAQPELCKYGQEPKSCTSSPMDCQCALDATFAQPEQDHVEWGVDWGADGSSVSIIKRLADGGIEVVGWEYAPHPPKRTWVGLTDDEIYKAEEGAWYMDEFDKIIYAKNIEAKLKEKNA